MLHGKGFQQVYNLAGGIKAWKDEVAVGPEDSGMFLFEGDVSAEDVIITGFGLEMGLRDFYLAMKDKVQTDEAVQLFEKLAEVEIIHQEQLLEIYKKLVGTTLCLEDFQKKIVEPAMEGGLTTEQYLSRYDFDLDKELDILSLAMAIEVQALDLYLRAAKSIAGSGAREALGIIADEERRHIGMLGRYIDQHKELV